MKSIWILAEEIQTTAFFVEKPIGFEVIGVGFSVLTIS